MGGLFSTEGFEFDLTAEEKEEVEKRKQTLRDHIKQVTKDAFGEAAKKIKEQQKNELDERSRLQAKRARVEPPAGATTPATASAPAAGSTATADSRPAAASADEQKEQEDGKQKIAGEFLQRAQRKSAVTA